MGIYYSICTSLLLLLPSPLLVMSQKNINGPPSATGREPTTTDTPTSRNSRSTTPTEIPASSSTPVTSLLPILTMTSTWTDASGHTSAPPCPRRRETTIRMVRERVLSASRLPPSTSHTMDSPSSTLAWTAPRDSQPSRESTGERNECFGESVSLNG